MEFPIELSLKALEKAQSLGIVPEDIEEKFVRGSGAGGQKVNKTNNCVWLRHLPSGTEVKVQEHREREANRKTAYRLLIDKIEEARLGAASERAQKVFKIQKQKKRRSRKSKEKMLEEKRQRGDIKNSRKKISDV